MDKRLALIGAGNMGEALLKGLLSARTFAPGGITAVDASPERLQYIASTYGVNSETSPAAAAAAADIVLLAVKPQVMPRALEELAPLEQSKLVASVAAGVTLDSLSKGLGGHSRLVRVMPNTPALVQAGISAYCAASGVTEDERALVRTVLSAVGDVVEVEERHMDAVTGLSGSGPAYVFVIIEALADGGVSVGLDRATAQLLAARTVLGAAKLLLERGEHPARLKDMVASPGGTTVAGLQALEEYGLRAALIAAVRSAARRSAELGKE